MNPFLAPARRAPIAIVAIAALLSTSAAFAETKKGSEVEFLTSSGQELMEGTLDSAAACDGGDHAHCYQLANLYEEGLGVPSAPDRSERLYKAACDAGRVDACRALGWLTVRSIGEAPWPKAGIEAFGKACELGLLDACVTLGEAQIRGEQLTSDPTRGALRLAKACSGGYPEGCHALSFWRDTLAKAGVDVDAKLGKDAAKTTLSPRLVCPALYFITTSQSGGPKLNRRLKSLSGADLLATIPESVPGYKTGYRNAADAGTAGMRASNASVQLQHKEHGPLDIFVADMAANCTLQPGTGRAMVVGERSDITVENENGQPYVVTETEQGDELRLWAADRCTLVISGSMGSAAAMRDVLEHVQLEALVEICGGRDAGLPF